MKHLRIAGLCLVAAFALSMAVSATASASPTWWQCREENNKENLTKFTNSKCAVRSSEGQWEWKQLETREEGRSKTKGNLKLIDKEATGGESEIECNGTDEGPIGPGNKDEITAITVSECKIVKGLCEEEATAKAIDLPWTTELAEEPTGSGKIRDKITAGGKGPGYKVECVVAKVFKVADECFGTTSTLMRNNESNGTVEAEFEKESPKGECSLSKKKSGEVLGIDVSEQLSGHYTQVRLN